MFPLDDTIAAIASAPGGAARGIVRLSGPDTFDVLSRCFVHDETAALGQSESPRVVSGQIRHGESSSMPADAFLWPGGRSYTREPLAEIHTLGSPVLLDTLLTKLCSSGARLARPGEFTLRAFLAGRIDLTQAEAVLGIVDATDRRQLDVALAQLAGGLATPLQKLRNDLVDLLADLEAGLDFVEQDIWFISRDDLQSRLSSAATQIDRLVEQLAARQTSGRLPRVVLLGLPNVGKSSLFNALLMRSAAIVSQQPGTTRDYLRAPIDAAGLAVELVDTAGIDACKPTHHIEAQARATATEQHEQADLRVVCLETGTELTVWEQEQTRLSNTLVLLTKCDLSTPAHTNPTRERGSPLEPIPTSSLTGAGLAELRASIRNTLEQRAAESHAVAATAARCGESIRLAGESVRQALQLAAQSAGDELIAAQVHTALNELGQIAGAVYNDDLLDRIFSRFCIGK